MAGKGSALERLVASAAALALAGLLLTSCGGKSSATSSGASATARSATTSTGASSSRAATSSPRQAKLRACMKRFGITLPASSSQGSGQHASGELGVEGGPQLPPGVSRTRFDMALERCGARSFGGTGLAGGRFNSPEFRAALGRFALCLRQNGIDIPAPHVFGNGPVFTTKGLKTSSPEFLRAERNCAPILAGAFRHARGASPPGTNPGAPGPLGKVPTKKK